MDEKYNNQIYLKFTQRLTLVMDGPKDESSKKKEDLGVNWSIWEDSETEDQDGKLSSASQSSKKKEDLGVKEDDKADRGYHYRSIHYRSIHDMKADSKADSITNSTVSASLNMNGPKDESSKKKKRFWG